MPDKPAKLVDVFVELLDEGTETWRGTKALDMGDGLYKLLPTSNYDPEDEIWAFLPGDIVALERAHTNIGIVENAVRHRNPDVIRIDVWMAEGSPLGCKRTNALALGGGLYKILPTPAYDPAEEKWEFVPGDIVRLHEITRANGLFKFLVPHEKVEDAG